MFSALLLVIAAALAVGGGLAFRKRRHLLAPDEERKLLRAPDRERTVADLRRGDIVQKDGQDFLVEGVVRYDEDGHRWVAGRLVDGSEERWLLIGLERAGAAGMKWLTVSADVEAGDYPPDAILAGGQRFRLDKRGTASASLDGVVGDLSAAARKTMSAGTVTRCQWWLYGAVGGGALLVEKWGDDMRALVGEDLTAAAVEFLPGS